MSNLFIAYTKRGCKDKYEWSIFAYQDPELRMVYSRCRSPTCGNLETYPMEDIVIRDFKLNPLQCPRCGEWNISTLWCNLEERPSTWVGVEQTFEFSAHDWPITLIGVPVECSQSAPTNVQWGPPIEFQKWTGNYVLNTYGNPTTERIYIAAYKHQEYHVYTDPNGVQCRSWTQLESTFSPVTPEQQLYLNAVQKLKDYRILNGEGSNPPWDDPDYKIIREQIWDLDPIGDENPSDLKAQSRLRFKDEVFHEVLPTSIDDPHYIETDNGGIIGVVTGASNDRILLGLSPAKFPVYTEQRDSNGNIIYDADGKAMMELVGYKPLVYNNEYYRAIINIVIQTDQDNFVG